MKNKRPLFLAGALLLVGFVLFGIFLYIRGDQTWDDDSTWNYGVFTFPAESDASKGVEISKNNNSYTVTIKQCTLYNIFVYNGVKRYVCNLSIPFDLFPNGISGDKTHVGTQEIIPEIQWEYTEAKSPLPSNYFKMKPNKKEDLNISGEYNPRPVSVQFAITFNRPAKDPFRAIMHGFVQLQNRKSAYEVELKDWYIKDESNLDANYLYDSTLLKITGEKISPWEYSDKTLTPTPALPSKEELYATYTGFRKSLFDEDFDMYKKFVSAERVWYTENPLEFQGMTSDELRVFKRLPGGSLVLQGPSVKCMLLGVGNAPINLGYALNKDPQYHTIDDIPGEKIGLLDASTKSVVQLVSTSWKYALKARFDIENNNYVSGSGDIVFVYDQGKWKYYGEYWNIVYTNTITGTLNTQNQNIVYAGDDAKANTFSDVIKVKEGGYVVWKNVKGMINSIEGTEPKFNSMYLQGQWFSQQFSKKGTYKYNICGQNYNFNGTVEVE